MRNVTDSGAEGVQSEIDVAFKFRACVQQKKKKKTPRLSIHYISLRVDIAGLASYFKCSYMNVLQTIHTLHFHICRHSSA